MSFDSITQAWSLEICLRKRRYKCWVCVWKSLLNKGITSLITEYISFHFALTFNTMQWQYYCAENSGWQGCCNNKTDSEGSRSWLRLNSSARGTQIWRIFQQTFCRPNWKDPPTETQGKVRYYFTHRTPLTTAAKEVFLITHFKRPVT